MLLLMIEEHIIAEKMILIDHMVGNEDISV